MCDGVVRDVRHELRQGVLTGEQHLGGAVVGDHLVGHGHEPDDHAERRRDETRFEVYDGTNDNPTHRIAHPSSAATAPTTRAQAIRAIVGSTLGGTEVRASENVPRLVQLSRPMKTRAPTPDASSPAGRPG